MLEEQQIDTGLQKVTLTGFLKIPSCRQSIDSLTKRAASLI